MDIQCPDFQNTLTFSFMFKKSVKKPSMAAAASCNRASGMKPACTMVYRGGVNAKFGPFGTARLLAFVEDLADQLVVHHMVKVGA
jgi:hypothetical protein